MNIISEEIQCRRGPSRFSPKRNSPRNEDSRKKENTPSIASVWPITPPADFENCRPVRAELKFHGNPGDDAEREADAENLAPRNARQSVPDFVAGAQGDGFQDEDQQGEAHGELRENVMEGDGESEVQAMNR